MTFYVIKLLKIVDLKFRVPISNISIYSTQKNENRLFHDKNKFVLN